MPIIQINIWICEVCGAIRTASKQVSPFSSVVVDPPGEEWDYLGEDEKLHCPKCVKDYERLLRSVIVLVEGDGEHVAREVFCPVYGYQSSCYLCNPLNKTTERCERHSHYGGFGEWVE